MDGETTTVNVSTEAAAPVAAPATAEPVRVFGYAPESYETGAAESGHQQSAGEQGKELSDDGQAEQTEANAQEQAEQQENPDAQRTSETGEKEKPATTEDATKQTQKDTGAAFKAERERAYERADAHYSQQVVEILNNDPVRNLGAYMAGRSLQDGEDMTQAAQRVMADARKLLVQNNNISEADAKALMEATIKKGTVKIDSLKKTPTVSERRAAQVQELVSMKMPDGFDLAKAANDPAFEELVDSMPAAFAVELYHLRAANGKLASDASNAERVIAEKVMTRAALPQSGKTAAANAKPDYKNMSAAQVFDIARGYGADF